MLGKQRVETMQVLNILLERTPSKGWRNHPVTLMWKGYEVALQSYQNATLKEWIRRGYRNNIKFEILEDELIFPNWFGDEKFHISHRSNLLRKDFLYYSQYFENVDSNLPYVWPVMQSGS